MLDWYSHWKAHIDALAEIRKHHRGRMRSKRARPSYYGNDDKDKVYSTEKHDKSFDQQSSNARPSEASARNRSKSRDHTIEGSESRVSTDLTAINARNSTTNLSKLSELSQQDQSEHLIFKREEHLLAFRLDNLNVSVTILYSKDEFHRRRQRQMILYLERLHVEQIRWAYRSKTTFRVNGVAIEAQDNSPVVRQNEQEKKSLY